VPVDPAEIVRTLASGHRPAHPHLPGNLATEPIPVIADADAAPVILLADDSPVATALRGDASLALRFDDRPPVPEAPWLGSGWVCGWAEPVDVDDQSELAGVFAAEHPVNDLLGLGDSHRLWRLSVAEVCLEDDSGLIEIDVDHYQSVEPDTWHRIEASLLMDLNVHHPDVLDALLHRIQHHYPAARRLNPLRMDRHGTTIDVFCDDEVKRFLIHHRPGVTRPDQILHSLAGCRCQH